MSNIQIRDHLPRGRLKTEYDFVGLRAENARDPLYLAFRLNRDLAGLVSLSLQLILLILRDTG